jgi:hypothetical protein
MDWIKDVSEQYSKLLDRAVMTPELTWQDIGIFGWLLSRGLKGEITEADIKPHLDDYEDSSSIRPSLRRLDYHSFIVMVEKIDARDPHNYQRTYLYEVLT